MKDQLFSILTPQSDEEFVRYFHFRWQQLRKPLGLPVGSEKDQLEQSAYHCMAVNVEKSVIGIGRIHLHSEHEMQIRYMAVDKAYQRIGVGTGIIQYLLTYAQEKHVTKCWLNARLQACRFYENIGFENKGTIESDLDIPHFRMEISLARS